MGTVLQNIDTNRRPIVEQCISCDRIKAEGEAQWCSAFAYPDTKWRLGTCSMATHAKVDSGKSGEKVRVGQQKQKQNKK